MVGPALKAGMLPRLRILGLANLEPQPSELIGLVGSGSHTVLHKLVLASLTLSDEGVRSLVVAIKAEGGALRALEELAVLQNEGSRLNPLLAALTSGEAPCARTLRVMEIGGASTYSLDAVASFFTRGLGMGRLPLLSKVLYRPLPRDLVVRIRDAITRLAFCPYLRRIYLDMNVNLGMNAIDVRKMRRDLIGTMEGGGLTPLEFVARLDAAEAPLRAEEIKERRTSFFSKPASARFQQMDSDGDY